MHRVIREQDTGKPPRRTPAAEVLDSQPNAGGQAGLVSNCWTLDAREPLIAIRRGFVASGIQAKLTTL